MKRAVVMTVAAVTLVVLVGCSETRQDRTKSDPDTTLDTTNVTVYRNADAVPNIATFCAGRYGWAATLNSDNGRGQLTRFPELDATCGVAR